MHDVCKLSSNDIQIIVSTNQHAFIIILVWQYLRSL